MVRGEPFSDYEQGPESIYAPWWPLMPLKRAFIHGHTIPNARWRHLFLYFDNRFANNMALLFHACNTIMRHNVNSAVGARVKSNAESFEKFKELLADPSFPKLLQDAQAAPKSEAGFKVVKRILSFVNCIAGKVPWSKAERASEMTKLMASMRFAGPASIFYSIAPDGVHNETTLRWSAPFTSYTSYPAQISNEWRTALQAQTPSERIVRNSCNVVIHRLDEATLQKTAAHNPVAEAVTFGMLLQNVQKNLFQNSSLRINNLSTEQRKKGVLGINVTYRDVKECNKRGCLHVHGQVMCASTPIASSFSLPYFPL